MVNYNNFDQFFTEGAGKNKEARIAFTKKWLKENYNISEANPEWVEQISDVHDHDGQPLHFGQIPLASSFTSLTTQLIKLHNVWHIATLKPNSNDASVIHPLKENSKEANNEKNRINLARLAKKGTLVKAQAPVYGIQFDQAPVALNANDIYRDKDSVPNPDMHAESLTAPVTPDAETKSVNIDMSSFFAK